MKNQLLDSRVARVLQGSLPAVFPPVCHTLDTCAIDDRTPFQATVDEFWARAVGKLISTGQTFTGNHHPAHRGRKWRKGHRRLNQRSWRHVLAHMGCEQARLRHDVNRYEQLRTWVRAKQTCTRALGGGAPAPAPTPTRAIVHALALALANFGFIREWVYMRLPRVGALCSIGSSFYKFKDLHSMESSSGFGGRLSRCLKRLLLLELFIMSLTRSLGAHDRLKLLSC